MECRTCLAKGVQLYKLDTPFMCSKRNDNDAKKDRRISFQECLTFCTRLKHTIGLPSYICIECSRALQITYVFIQNAIKAHEILCQRVGVAIETTEQTDNESSEDPAMCFRCKICQKKVATKKALKEHIRLHLDVITYSCEICDFDCKKRTQLGDHYSDVHHIAATSDQLKPSMQAVTEQNTMRKEQIKTEDEDEIKTSELFACLEERKKEQEEAEILLAELEERMRIEQQNEGSLKEEQNMDMQEFLADVQETEANAAFGINFNDIDLAAAIPTENMSQYFGNELSVGNEFLVLADGSVQKVDGSDVVIEYINNDVVGNTDSVAILDGSNLVVDNIVQIATNETEAPMDFERILDETTNALNFSSDSRTVENNFLQNRQNEDVDETTSTTSSGKRIIKKKKLIKCKICTQFFYTQNELKIHMLTHSEIPHFFCDRCAFYTFFKNDLTQHYKSVHKCYPTPKQLLPKNKNETQLGKIVYSCDLCLYETSSRFGLREHYMVAHRIEATEVQLRPTIDNTDFEIKPSSNQIKLGFKTATVVCKLCKKLFSSPKEYREHLLWHKQEKKNEALNRVLKPQINFNDSTNVTNDTTESIDTETMTNESTNNLIAHNIGNNIIENNVVLPMDAIPQIVESEQTIENDGMDFDFNGDAIFGDFDTVDSINESADDTVENLALTSEDELGDLLDDRKDHDKMESRIENNSKLQQQQSNAFCVHCNKRFFSQYHFENHMFIHRGLAPYRCELCTNLYNTKRALIRHYKAVHKTMPNRDMVQAKGDKGNFEAISTEELSLEDKQRSYMCAKCPFETAELLNIQLHLSNSHNITDENFILHKLPYECQRCIRSFATKSRLLRHLEHNHAPMPIVQQQNVKPRSATRAATTPTIATTNANTRAQNAVINNEIVDSTAIVEQEMYAANQAMNVTSSTTGIVDENLQLLTSKTTTIDTEHQQQQQQHPYQDAVNEVEEILQQQLYDANLWQGEINATAAEEGEPEKEDKIGEEQQLQQPYDYNNVDIVGEITVPTTITTSTMASDSIKFQCTICHGNYKSAALLKFHMKRHTERKFRCTLCPKSFITRTDLDLHSSLHAGLLKFQCDICEKKFGYSHHLKRHKDSAHLGKRHVCTVKNCGKMFTSSSQLKVHSRVHNNSQPYKCEQCNRCFNRRHVLRIHARKVHGVDLTEAEIAEVFRKRTGHTNPHDLIVAHTDGQYIRRSDIEAAATAAVVPLDEHGEISTIEVETEDNGNQ